MAVKTTVILQSHIDMVCEKTADSSHNFECDPIEPRIDGEWVCANNTTLGADDGIGVATQLAILASESVEHPPIVSSITSTFSLFCSSSSSTNRPDVSFTLLVWA